MSQEKVAFAKAIVKCAGDVSAGDYFKASYSPTNSPKERLRVTDNYLMQPFGALKAQMVDAPKEIGVGMIGGFAGGRLSQAFSSGRIRGGRGAGRLGAVLGGGIGMLLQPISWLNKHNRGRGLRKHPEFAGHFGAPRALKND